MLRKRILTIPMVFCLAACTASAPSSAAPIVSSDSTESILTLYQTFAAADKDNAVCSPLSIWLALAMLSDTTAADSQKQLLNLLGAEDEASLKQEAERLYEENVWSRKQNDDGEFVDTGKDADFISRLSSSMWLSDAYPFNEDALEKTSQDFHAELHTGTPGSAEFNAAFQKWLNESTNGLLKDQVKDMKLSETTVLALLSSIYYKAPWLNSFSEVNTVMEPFHTPDGDRDVDMMHMTDTMYWLEEQEFQAVGLPLVDSSICWIILPDEKLTPKEIIADPDLEELLEKGQADEDVAYTRVSLSLPKIDVTGEKCLIEGLQSLGLHDVFDAQKADFSPISDADNLVVTKIQHDARFTADESGVEAAAFTAIMVEMTGIMLEEPVEFKVDRPFLFALMSPDNALLFGGTINNPSDH